MKDFIDKYKDQIKTINFFTDHKESKEWNDCLATLISLSSTEEEIQSKIIAINTNPGNKDVYLAELTIAIYKKYLEAELAKKELEQKLRRLEKFSTKQVKEIANNEKYGI